MLSRFLMPATLWPRVAFVVVMLGGLMTIGCTTPEDPALAPLRLRLTQPTQLSADELAQVRGEVSKAIAGKRVRIKDGASLNDMNEEQKVIILGMLTDAAGMFDEGLKEEGGATFRVLNSPGDSPNAEIEASRRLWINTRTFLPYRFIFAFAFAGYGDYTFDLAVEQGQ